MPSRRCDSRPPRRWPPGPVLFERLDWRPYGIRPVLPIAATQPPGEPDGSTASAGRSRASCSRGLTLADADPALAEALDRWELSLFQHEPFRAEQLRAALRRSSARRGRSELPCCSRTRPSASGGAMSRCRTVRRPATETRCAAAPLVEVLRHGDRASSSAARRELLGLGPTPLGVGGAPRAHSAHKRHDSSQRDTRPATVVQWTRPALLDGSTGSTRSIADGRPAELLASCAPSWRRRGARAEGGDAESRRRSSASHGAGTRHNRRVIAHWDEATLDGASGPYRGEWSNLGAPPGRRRSA